MGWGGGGPTQSNSLREDEAVEKLGLLVTLRNILDTVSNKPGEPCQVRCQNKNITRNTQQFKGINY